MRRRSLNLLCLTLHHSLADLDSPPLTCLKWLGRRVKEEKMKPYFKSHASPMLAQGRIKELLRKFGVQMVTVADDFEAHEVYIIFKYRNIPVKIPLNYGRLALKWLEDQPYAYRMRSTRAEYEARIKETAYRASYSILEDFLKAMVTMVDLGIRTFEEVFLADFDTAEGQRFGEL